MPANKNTILIVDDDSGILEIESAILKNAGYNVIVNRTGDLEFMQPGNYPDLILLDNYLGNTTGSDICKSLKENDRTKNIPVILISGSEGLYDIAENACADDFLSKPFSIQNLLHKIEFLLNDIAESS